MSDHIPSSPPDSGGVMSHFPIPDEHLAIGDVRIGDRVELLTQKTHYILDRLGETDWRIHAFETPDHVYQVLPIGSQPPGTSDTVPDVLAEGLCMVVRTAHNNARMISRKVKKIVWKRGYH